MDDTVSLSANSEKSGSLTVTCTIDAHHAPTKCTLTSGRENAFLNIAHFFLAIDIKLFCGEVPVLPMSKDDFDDSSIVSIYNLNTLNRGVSLC